MRELTKEQREFVLRVNSPEFREAARKNQEAEEAAMATAKARSDKRGAEQRAQWEEEARRQREAIRPLKEAMRAAGIKLQLSSYEGVWGGYQIGDGPVVDIDTYNFDTEED